MGYFQCYTLGKGWGGAGYLVELVSLNKVQPVLSKMCDFLPLRVNALLELARFYLFLIKDLADIKSRTML